MILGLSVLLGAAGAVLTIPVLVFFVECLLGVLPARGGRVGTDEQPRSVVLIPAHDEELVLGATLASLTAQLPSWIRVLVIADNCTDGTAAIARGFDVDVLERQDPTQRGKGYALRFGLAHLQRTPPDVVLVVDADCIVSEGGVVRLAQLAQAHQRPVQADNLVEPAANPRVRSRISAFAFAVRNRVRARGLVRLGGGCQLMGTGMAIPYHQFTHVSVGGSDLVEDLALGLELTKCGWPPLYTDEARIVSREPDDDAAALGQRRRWEQGQIRTAFVQGPKLLAHGFARGSRATIAMAFDVLVPPLALLVTLVGGFAALTLAAWYALRVAWPAFGALGLLALLITAVVLCWFNAGRSILHVHHLLLVPLYVAWKLPVYVALVFRRGQKTWQRTARAAAGSTDPSRVRLKI